MVCYCQSLIGLLVNATPTKQHCKVTHNYFGKCSHGLVATQLSQLFFHDAARPEKKNIEFCFKFSLKAVGLDFEIDFQFQSATSVWEYPTAAENMDRP